MQVMTLSNSRITDSTARSESKVPADISCNSYEICNRYIYMFLLSVFDEPRQYGAGVAMAHFFLAAGF